MIHLPSWNKTSLGTPVPLFASADLASLNRPLLLMGGIHGDEPEGVELATKTLAMLQSMGSAIPLPWILIPCLNVDGFKSNTRVNGRGVDLNRNYPSPSWSPHFEKDRYHPGPSPGSEPEIQGVVDLLLQRKPRLVIHCHSWKPMIVCTGEPTVKDGERLARSSGYEVVPEIGYDTPGSLSQYGWVDNKIPVICIEEKSGIALGEVWPHFASAMREIFMDSSSR